MLLHFFGSRKCPVYFREIEFFIHRLLSFSSCLRFLSDYPCRFTGAPACPFPFVLVLASSPRQVVGTAATTSRRNRRSIEHPDEKCRSHVREVTAVGCLPVVELVIEYVQRFIGNEEPAAFPVDVDMVRAGTGTIAGVLRNRCRSLCVNRNRPGCSRYRFPCGGLCRNSPCLGSRVQLFPRAFKFGRHEVAPPAEFGSLVSGVAFLQHVTAQYLLVVAQLPKLISLAPESGHVLVP